MFCCPEVAQKNCVNTEHYYYFTDYHRVSCNTFDIQQNTEKQMEDVKELQAKLKQMSTDARDKDVLYKQLVCTFEQSVINC